MVISTIICKLLLIRKQAQQMRLTPSQEGSSSQMGVQRPISPRGPPSSVLCMNPWGLTRPHRAIYVRRTQANKVKARLTTGATGHDEGNDIVIRSATSCTWAPSLSKRSWIVSIVAQAQGVVLNTSRRKVSSNTEAAECKNTRN